ncbi:MAG: hypothetical protein JNK79_05955 [Chitinophagaceae bacterium]|nr:hypothetical protein [Chitinophagaceae bacterium]
MHIPQNIEEKLWSYIDGSLEKKELDTVEELLRSNNEWKNKYAELMEVHQLMKNNMDLEHPSLRFTQNVMEEISRLYITPATRNYINKNVIWGIGIFFLTTIIGLLIYGFGQIDWSQTGGIDSPQLQEINNINWSRVFSGTYVNVFIMVNILLGLMLLDMYLTRKKNERIRERNA